MKKRLTAVLMAVAILVTVTAYFTPAVSAEGDTLADELPIEQTTAQDTDPVEVHDFAELTSAIIRANGGDTIIIMGVIEIPASTYVNDMGKGLTLRRGSLSSPQKIYQPHC